MNNLRIAVINKDLCKYNKCSYSCIRACPINKTGKECIVVNDKTKFPIIDENTCIGCNICVKVCPYSAIDIVNLPQELREEPIYRYGNNGFVLFRIVVPRRGNIVGIIGQNGTGKTTMLKILTGKLKPVIEYEKLVNMYRGNEAYNYIIKMKKGVNFSYKPQNVDSVFENYKKEKVEDIIEKFGGERKKELVSFIKNIKDRRIFELSGGELQLLLIILALSHKKEFYFFDEISSYVDVFKRFMLAGLIRNMCKNSYVVAVEHDIALLDYLSDYVHILFGKPGVFGIVSQTYSVRHGINRYLEGYIREENIKFRDSIIFSKISKEYNPSKLMFEYDEMEKNYEKFKLKVSCGNVHESEIIGILGRNGTGKSTFIGMLSGKIRPDIGKKLKLNVSVKVQRIYLERKVMEGMDVDDIAKEYNYSLFTNIIKKVGMERIMNMCIEKLSGGELQIVLIARAISKEHEVLFLDEPSAFLDIEQRLRIAKIVREWVSKNNVCCMVVDHDLQFIDFISNRLIVFEGIPGIKGFATTPLNLKDGMNRFLKSINITFRRDKDTGRARANKKDSIKDREQKISGEYFYEG